MTGRTRLDRDHVVRLLRYHHWANDQLFDAGASMSTQELDARWGGSFGSGRALLQHMLGAERLWSARWRGESPRTMPGFPATHDGADFLAEWESVKAEQVGFADTLTQAAVDADITYANIKGETWTYPMADVLVHVVNHGTYHRGQLAQLLRDRGRPATSTDFILFVQRERA